MLKIYQIYFVISQKDALIMYSHQLISYLMIYSFREGGWGARESSRERERKRRPQLALWSLISSLIGFVEVLEGEQVAFGMNEG